MVSSKNFISLNHEAMYLIVLWKLLILVKFFGKTKIALKNKIIRLNFE